MKEIIYKGYKCTLTKGKYGEGNTALLLDDSLDGQRVATLTRNFPGQLAEHEVAIDLNNCGIDVIFTLINAKVIEEGELRWIESGYVRYPVYKLY